MGFIFLHYSLFSSALTIVWIFCNASQVRCHQKLKRR